MSPASPRSVALAVDAQARGEELGLQRLGPAAVGQGLLRRLGGEAADEALFRGHHGISSSSVTGPSLTSSIVHVGAEHAAAGAEALAEALVERLGVLRAGRRDVGRAVAPAGVAVERELGDAQHLALAERLVHAALGVGEDAQRADLVGEPVGVPGSVVVGHAEQHEQPGADRARPARRRRRPPRGSRAGPAPSQARAAPRAACSGATMHRFTPAPSSRPARCVEPRQDVDPPAEVLGAAAARCASTGSAAAWRRGARAGAAARRAAARRRAGRRPRSGRAGRRGASISW